MAWLHRLARMGDTRRVTEAIASGDDVNSVTRDGWTPLLLAAREGHAEVITALLAAGADLNLPHPNGRSPLHFAASNGHLAAVRTLAAAGADVNGVDGQGDTPLIEAAKFNRVEAVEALRELGSNTNWRDRDGMTADDWLSVGGVIGDAEAALERVKGPKVDGLYAATAGMEANVRRKMTEEPNADRFAAIHGRNVWCCSYGLHRFEDPAVHAWAHRLAAILADRALLTECEERYLTGEDFDQARERREKEQRRELRETRKRKRIERGR